MTDRIAVVTVTYSPGEHLAAFLAGIDAATTREVDVVIADNGSTDGAPEAAAEDAANVTLVYSGGNIGYGAAVNRAVAQVDPDIEFVLIANPDIRLTSGCVDELIAVAQRWPRAGAVGPLIREPDGSVYSSARELPDLVAGTGHALLGRVWSTNPWTLRYRREAEEIVERSAGWLSGSCLLVRRVAFDSVNGFDSRYFMFMEDVDLGDRLARAGWLNVYGPSAEVVHHQGHSQKRYPELMLPAHHEGVLRYQSDRHPKRRHAPLRWAMSAALDVRSRLVTAAAVRDAKNPHS
ncbi:glycosyltransferase family 2 protein [Williamsia sp. CHRR-6]|uniref:glycosyltransferase family 2 protein n=1 Tax=Williamsia sp. CHRR-6 TaxID=2835871 RepID=UPI001BDB373A|nr:glycosyltransferase family 2 protein [Williamsia sp. CHRR-6]MBT0568474.1 glycosyltransferase family 2 protein [Williamsia sp. CHRR-6]